MKKKILFALITLFVIVAALSSCGKCKHESFELKTVKVAATCDEGGIETWVCTDCGEERDQDTEALGHELGEPNVVEPTCVAGGYSEYACTREGCDYTEKKHETRTDPSKHVYKELRQEPTCTKNGKIEKQCEICLVMGGSETKLEKLGHSYARKDATGITVIEPTCRKDGKLIFDCTDCDEADFEVTNPDDITNTESAIYALLPATHQGKAEVKASITKLGHDVESYEPTADDYTAHTCENDGTIRYYCVNERCDGADDDTADVRYYEDVVNNEDLTPGHLYDINGTEENVHYVITKATTCLSSGLRTLLCTVCGEIATQSDEEEKGEDLVDIEIPKLEHFTTWEKTGEYDATCLRNFYIDIKCTSDANCEETDELETENTILSHVYNEFVRKVDPSCAGDGYTIYRCSNGCGKDDPNAKNVEVVDNEGAQHNYDKTRPVKTRTCCEYGTYMCTVCGNEFAIDTEELINAYIAANNYDDGESKPTDEHAFTVKGETVAPTCFKEGYTVYGCANGNCGKTMNKEYTAKTAEHTFAAKTPDGVLTCTTCSRSYRDITVKVDADEGKLCLCKDPACTCNVKWQWTGYTKPEAPVASASGTASYDKAMNYGLIEINVGAAANVTIVLKDAEGNVLAVSAKDDTAEKTGGAITSVGNAATVLTRTTDGEGVIYFDLYDIKNVASVEITSDVDYTVSFYSVITND